MEEESVRQLGPPTKSQRVRWRRVLQARSTIGTPQSEDSAASALREVLESRIASFRFCSANQGMPKAATTNNAMPTTLVRGS